MLCCVSKFTPFLPQPEGAYPCKIERCPSRYFKRASGANKHMMVEHGIKPPSSYLYLPMAKKPKKKRVKRSSEEGAAGMRSMPADNSCAYHLASMAIYATLHPDVTDLDQWPSDVASARTIVVNKYFDMKERFLAFLDDASLSDRSDQLKHWESMMS